MSCVGSNEPEISIRDLWAAASALPRPALDLCDRLLSLDQLKDVYRSTRDAQSGSFPLRLLRQLNIECEADPADLEHVPRRGPVVAVVNHPHGLLDGALVGATLLSVRPDVKIVTNHLLASVHEIEQHCIFIDPFGGSDAAGRNLHSLRQALDWLSAGKLLVMFPAGEVSHWEFGSRTVTDPIWRDTAARLIRRTRAVAVPVFLEGENSVPFQILGLLHARLRTAALPAELLNKQGRTVRIHIGRPVTAELLDRIPTAGAVTKYLRSRTYSLAECAPPRTVKTGFRSRAIKAVADPVPATELAAEVAALAPEQCMARSTPFSVYMAKAGEIPKSLREIGRLREIAFRSAGEGTGRALDLDRFDEEYDHLFAWNEQTQQIVGAYRLCRADRVMRQGGLRGLYTHTLFRFGNELIENFGPCLELGRSFIRPEYQRHFTPLLLLWRGIGRYIAVHPEIAVLFGAVSISSQYRQLSRRLIVSFFLQQASEEYAGLVQARRPLRSNVSDGQSCRSLASVFRNLDDLSAVITDVEADRKSIPVLVRQYARLGGRMLAFNVDPKFSDALDGFVVVDMRRTEVKLLERYLGRENAAEFWRVHGPSAT